MAKNTPMANSAQIPANQSQHSCLLWNWRWDKQRELEGWNGCPEGTSGMWSSHGSTPPAQDQLLLPPAPPQPSLWPANLLEAQLYLLGSQRAFLSHRHIKEIKLVSD